MIAIWYRIYCLIHCINSYFILPSLISFMKRFVGRPWIQRFQLFATGAQRRGDGDVARSTFPSGSIRRLVTRTRLVWNIDERCATWMFFKCTFCWNQEGIQDNMIINIYNSCVGRSFSPSSPWSSEMSCQHGFSVGFRSIQVLGLQDKLAQGGQWLTVRFLWRFVDIQDSSLVESLTGGLDSHLFLCSLHSHSHRECWSRCGDLQKRLYTMCDLYLFHFLRLGKESWNDMVCSHDHSIMLRHVSHTWLMAHRCGSSEGGRHFGGPRPEGKICLWYFVAATLLQRGTQKTTD